MFNPEPVLPKFLLLVWLGCQALSVVCALPLQSATASQAETRKLEPGKTIERDITAGETHAYEITVEAGQFIQLVSQQAPLRASLRLLDSSGKPLSLSEDIAGGAQLKVRAIAAATGRYRVEF